jgi:UDP-N-acetyl-D-galactosamine dehydrogenase
LVGGHCIGVDPYYLTHKAEAIGYHPQVILAGRRINDNMGAHVASSVVKLMAQKGSVIKGSKALVLGITFKENCPDIRNSKVIDVVKELHSYGIEVDTYDPQADKEEVKHEYGIDLINELNIKYNAIVLAVSHKEFANLSFDAIRNKSTVVYDIKGFLDKKMVDKRL